jgi:cation diffusion facilitator family transporter
MPLDHSERLRAGWVSAASGAAIFAGKVLAYVITGSAAVFSDAMESIVNVVAAALLVWSLRVAARPADPEHPYGHGKVEFFSAGIEGALIVVAAVLIAMQAVRQLVAGAEPQQLDAGLALLGAASLANAALGAFLVRSGRRHHSLALVADGKHVLADVWTSVGVIAGLVVVRFTGIYALDPIVALAVAVWIVREGTGLVRRAVLGLMDAADDALLASLAALLEKDRPAQWIDVHGLRAWRSGAELHVDLHLVVPRYLDVDRLHTLHDEIERRLEPLHGEAVVHFDPCRPAHCAGCLMPACPVRSAPPGERPILTRERVTRTDPAAGE